MISGVESGATFGPELLGRDYLHEVVGQQVRLLSELHGSPQFDLPPELTSDKIREMEARGLNLPLVVDPRIPLETLVERAVINDLVPERQYVDLIVPPDARYLVWTHGRNKWGRLSISQASKRFPNHRVEGSRIKEVVHFRLFYPEQFVDAGFEAAGSRGYLPGERVSSENETAPYVSKFSSDLRLAVGAIDNHVSGWHVSSHSAEYFLLE